MGSSLVRTKGLLLLIAALMALSLSCQSDASAEPTVDPVQDELRTAIAGVFTIDELKVEFARLAIRVARSGCAGVDESLSGAPARVLISLTNSATASKFISSEGKFRHGPGGSGSVPVLVVAVEGRSVRTSNDQAPIDRAFVFVEPLAAPDFTTCAVEDAPMVLGYAALFADAFEFESIELP